MKNNDIFNLISDISLNGLVPEIKQQDINQVITNNKNKISLKSKNNQQEFIDKAISDRKKLEEGRGIIRDIKNPLYLSFLAGFFEGEGNSTISVVVSNSFKYGVNLQPVWEAHQDISGILILNSFLELFGCGSIVLKHGSDHVYTYTLKGYKQIIPNVLPFVKQFVMPYACKVEQFILFETILLKLANGEHKTQQGLSEMVKLCYLVKGKGTGRKRLLNEVLSIISDKDSYFARLDNELTSKE